MPCATASRKSGFPIRPKKSSQMPAQFSLSLSARRNLARSRRHNFPASPVFSQLESCHGPNLVDMSRSAAQFDRAVRHSCLRRQETKPLDLNSQHSSLQITAKCRRVPSLNRRAAFPQNPGTSEIFGVTRIQARIRFHVARIPGAFDRVHQSNDSAAIRSVARFRTPNFAEYRTPLASMLDWPKTTSVA
jgi:hypothetical protein